MAAPKKAAAKPELEPGMDGYVPATAKLYEDDKVRVKHVGQLEGNDAVAARTGPDAKSDGKFRAEFTLSGRDAKDNESNDDMHRANQVATLQRALNQGVHPKGEAALEGTRTLADGSVVFTYAVKGVPADEDDDPAGTFTPRKSIEEMGGSTIESAQNPDAEVPQK